MHIKDEKKKLFKKCSEKFYLIFQSGMKGRKEG